MIERVERWFGVEEAWQRPAPGPRERRADLWWALIALVVIALGQELTRSVGMLEDERGGPWAQYAGFLTLVAMVAVRRRYPVAVALLGGTHMIVMSVVMPMTMAQLPVQMVYFLLIFSGMAWARNRRALMLAIGVVLVQLVLLFAWSYAIGSGLDEIRRNLGESDIQQVGPIPPLVAIVLFSVLGNVIFFGFAIGLGQIAWRGALRQAQVEQQAETIRAQTARLTDQAVVAERLRIARELHDVVAHHVSVMGVQAAAARRVMDRDPAAARSALGAIEQASRDGVGQMRDLLGTLRAGEDQASTDPRSAAGARSPQPTLAALPALVEQATTPTCAVTADVVESTSGAAGRVPPPVQLTAYRIVQEALANVRRHSTARQARVAVRVDEAAGTIEVEVVDDGSPRPGTSGTGLGLLGMRERAQHLGGGVEAGRRQGEPGWRVRVWLPMDGRRPLAGTADEDTAPDPARESVGP
ncbi:Putative two-component system sensor kinase [Serinicoccus hydrothermalis]|uniref:histidine kinase n=1 Tax=Serinicoccus hydrothermalis TaxID=1758689 RepID=A0A1B1NCA8_9MICO|nr:histidine kinase [Serinicoccus hydrothermalis]ANS79062.1 Putative two-component system sensor kinase [Serinicoccus hydrothermalis]